MEPNAEAGSRWRPVAYTVVRWGGLLVVVALAITLYGRDDRPGPKAADVEAELIDYAGGLGLEITAECPDSVQDTPPGDTFECVAQGASGAVRDVEVTNADGGPEWDRKPFVELLRVDRNAGG